MYLVVSCDKLTFSCSAQLYRRGVTFLLSLAWASAEHACDEETYSKIF